MPSTPQPPKRSLSTSSGPAPDDAIHSDDCAIDDALSRVDEDGTIDDSRPVAVPAERLKKRSASSVMAEEPEAEEQQEGKMKEFDDEQTREKNKTAHMQQIEEGLWIGDLIAAMDTKGLEAANITNIVSLLRPGLDFAPQFSVHVLEIDDAKDTDILSHLPDCVAFIQKALEEKKGGVLVHCQAGMSRSATVTAAYLMQTRDWQPMEAVEYIQERRPCVDPSDTFWIQLMLYYNASCRVSLKDRQTRQFFMERNTTSVMNDGARPALENMARFPATPTPSEPATPQGSHGRRKIRCKMCRRHLAVREHMMDHILDQSPISRPRTPSASFNLPSPSVPTTAEPAFRSRVPSISEIINPLTGLPGATTRERTLSMSSADVPMPRASAPGLALTSTSSDINKPERTASPAPIGPRRTSSPAHLNAEQLASRLPPHLLALRSASSPGSGHSSPFASSPPNGSPQASQPASPDSAKDSHSMLLQQQSAPAPSSGAAIASRRLSMLALTPNDAASSPNGIPPMGGGPPILVNPKCSGYFVEPLTWMEPTIASGIMAGKLVCPNEKCGVKIGNFDWAGVQCGCHSWVTPGFCIARSKVDEVF